MKDQNKSVTGLYEIGADRDACGVGFIASRHNTPSRKILKKSFEALQNLSHRGAVDADGKTGDGVGILTSIPKNFYEKQAKQCGVDLGGVNFGIAMVFYPTDAEELESCEQIFQSVIRKHNIKIIFTRDVPVNKTVLGEKAKSSCPLIRQEFLVCPDNMTRDEFEMALFLMRKEIEGSVEEQSYENFYITSMSSVTIVHKGLFLGCDIENFYLDLQSTDFVSAFVLFHQRFSTNTFPTWGLAHPFRMMAHNGEINTIKGNRNWMYAREQAEQAQRAWMPDHYAARRFIMANRSDSASFDNALETYYFGGRSILHAVIHMMPEAWQNQTSLDEDLRAFYEYHACLSEQWDGPAAVAFSDGNIVGAIVDRNGLRPARYKITRDYLFVCSEMGCVSFSDADVIENGKLSPGTIIAINLKRKRILKNEEIKFALADQKPYASWIEKRIFKVNEELMARNKSVFHEKTTLTTDEAKTLQKVFGYTQEDLDLILTPIFRDGQEATGSMGDDAPLAVFSQKPRLLYSYFKQLFAQVTNPPIDPIRERYVTSLRMYLGKSGNIFEESHQHAHQIRVRGPLVTKSVFDEIKRQPNFPHALITTQFAVVDGPEGLEDAVMSVCLAAEKAVDDGNMLVILSDRYVNKDYAPIPMLLAVSAVHQHLVRVGKRPDVSLLVETGEARETHHFACLIGYGASVIYPYLALHQAVSYAEAQEPPVNADDIVKKYIKACEKGLLKILSKMGVSVLQSYHAAQLFEALGIKTSVAKFHFGSTPSKINGADLADIARDYLWFHEQAYQTNNSSLDVGGFYRFRREGEYHGNNPAIIKALHKAVSENDQTAYDEFKNLVNLRQPMTIRDLLDFKKVKTPLALTEVEPASEIVKRFCTPGISYGSISKEVHETFAVAMNQIGAKSDSGEGGENPDRYQIPVESISKNSAIKQVASGRFGVTAQYLSMADELEIKIAQGAKPGEGGQLPGHKVSVEIAQVRFSTPGVTLISPPPHHDIYSIEDLAQLIYDLKQANPKARISVKLVSEDGVGTIAAGVAKAYADTILISGHDGGTGASPLSSIKNAGLPWELGLAETQQALVRNSLRERVLLRVDGGFKTGLDVIKAALLGAEEFGFGTSSLMSVGCVMVRQCHLNTCPVGIATQDPELRKKFKGTPEHLIRYFFFVAEEVRNLLAEMGFRKLEELTGRVDLLLQKDSTQDLSEKARKVSLEKLLDYPGYSKTAILRRTWDSNVRKDFENLDELVVRDAKDLLMNGKGHVQLNYQIRNIHRSVGALISHHIVRNFGPSGFPEGQLSVYFKGTAGQSFGAFAMRGLHLHLEGEANDFVGKGLSGAVLSVHPSKRVRFMPEHNIICGNTCLYGATSGKVFINGRAGERFAVRNSGATAVVEGIGDHGCEYMTGGQVLILGSCGHNFGAGMTGGVAYVYDREGSLKMHLNVGEVDALDVDWGSLEAQVFLSLLNEHYRITESPMAKRLLERWEVESKRFLRVLPKRSNQIIRNTVSFETKEMERR